MKNVSRKNDEIWSKVIFHQRSVQQSWDLRGILPGPPRHFLWHIVYVFLNVVLIFLAYFVRKCWNKVGGKVDKYFSPEDSTIVLGPSWGLLGAFLTVLYEILFIIFRILVLIIFVIFRAKIIKRLKNILFQRTVQHFWDLRGTFVGPPGNPLIISVKYALWNLNSGSCIIDQKIKKLW